MSVISKVHGASFLVNNTAPADVVIVDDMGEDERLLMRSIQEFAAQEVAPVLDRIEQRDEATIKSLFRKAADLGIFMAEVPESFGGLGLNVLAIAGMSESRSYLAGLSSTVFAHQGIGTLPLINFGTDAQIAKYLQGCMDGELMAAFALTEANSGSDAMNIKTTAVLDDTGTHYIINGSKQWITNAGWADLFILFAKVDGTAFTAFLVERNTPGFSVGPHERLLGLHGSSVCSLSLQDVQIPIDHVLGEVGKGHRVAMCTLNLGRMKMSANCAGTSKKALTTATAYATERQQFGQPIADFGAIQAKLAEMAARAYAAESVAYRTAGLVYAALEGLDCTERRSLDAKLSVLTEFAGECAIAKVFGSETYHALSDETLQIFGGNGFSEEYPAARMYRDSRITRIYEGTSEICRLSITKGILKRINRGLLVLPTSDGELQGVNSDGQRVLHGFKAIYQGLLRELLATIGTQALLENDKQGHLLNLATIAIDLYAAESTVLRVAKLTQTRVGIDLSLAEQLTQLGIDQSTRSIRQAATEILSTLHTGKALRLALIGLQDQLPLPPNMITLREHIARALVERGGTLPHFPMRQS